MTPAAVPALLHTSHGALPEQLQVASEANGQAQLQFRGRCVQLSAEQLRQTISQLPRSSWIHRLGRPSWQQLDSNLGGVYVAADRDGLLQLRLPVMVKDRAPASFPLMPGFSRRTENPAVLSVPAEQLVEALRPAASRFARSSQPVLTRQRAAR